MDKPIGKVTKRLEELKEITSIYNQIFAHFFSKLFVGHQLLFFIFMELIPKSINDCTDIKIWKCLINIKFPVILDDWLFTFFPI